MDVSRPHEGGESRSDHGMLPDYVTTNITLLSTGTGSAGLDRKEGVDTGSPGSQARRCDVTDCSRVKQAESGLSRTGPAYILHDPPPLRTPTLTCNFFDQINTHYRILLHASIHTVAA